MITVQQLEAQLADAKKLIERREMAQRLFTNRDFKRLIVDEFMGTECARYAQESGDPALDANGRADALALAQAAGHLKRFLSVVIQMSSAAERNIADIEQVLEEVRAEEAQGDDLVEAE